VGAPWIAGLLLALSCAAPVLAVEHPATGSIQLAKFVEDEKPLPRHETPLQVTVSEKSEFYDIDGSTSEELRAQMKRKGTHWNDGKIYAALTTWDIRYHYDIESKDGKYALRAVRASVDIAFHLPRLMPSPKTPDQLKASWHEYYEHLLTHEHGHRDLSVEMTRDMCRRLSELGEFTDRAALEDAAKSLIKGDFKKLNQAQVEYDEDTHHGIKQGAVLTEPSVASAVPEAKPVLPAP
jgi:predicted secreted Zn-dependent protease